MANWGRVSDDTSVTTNKHGYSAVLYSGENGLSIGFTAPASGCIARSDSLIAMNAPIRVDGVPIKANAQCADKGLAVFLPRELDQGTVKAIFHFGSSVKVEFNSYDSQTYSAMGYKAQSDRIFNNWVKSRK